jgi:hypothetical protein
MDGGYLTLAAALGGATLGRLQFNPIAVEIENQPYRQQAYSGRD